jgi:signal transduction histidine kinase
VPVWQEGAAYTLMTVRDVADGESGEERAERLREDLIATVSHELRTPLTSIIGYTELLQDLPDDDLSATARRLVGVVHRNAARELRLVDDLLTLAFLGEERMSVALGPVDLGEIVRSAAETGRTPARRRGLTLEVQDARVAPVQGDAQRLGQVVDNLLTNAVKFTPPGGRVVLRVLDDGDAALLEVADTGPGVPAEDLERIFERLYRSEAAVRAQVPGAGLGLPIVRAIMEAHGGRVEATSEAGAGTIVRAWVPYASALTSTTAEASSGP